MKKLENFVKSVKYAFDNDVDDPKIINLAEKVVELIENQNEIIEWIKGAKDIYELKHDGGLFGPMIYEKVEINKDKVKIIVEGKEVYISRESAKALNLTN